MDKIDCTVGDFKRVLSYFPDDTVVNGVYCEVEAHHDYLMINFMSHNHFDGSWNQFSLHHKYTHEDIKAMVEKLKEEQQKEKYALILALEDGIKRDQEKLKILKESLQVS